MRRISLIDRAVRDGVVKMVALPSWLQTNRQDHVNRETLAEGLLLRANPVIRVKAHPLEEDLISSRRVVARKFTCHRGASIGDRTVRLWSHPLARCRLHAPVRVKWPGPSGGEVTGEQQVMARILVTDAARFIGFHLAERLLKRGEEVIGLDNRKNCYDCGCGNGCFRNPQLGPIPGSISCSSTHNELARSHSISICRIVID